MYGTLIGLAVFFILNAILSIHETKSAPHVKSATAMRWNTVTSLILAVVVLNALRWVY